MMKNSNTLWDIPTRLFHWLLVIAFLSSWLSMELELMEVHVWSGYGLMWLLLFRLGWGLFGSTSARFSSFLCRPSKVLAYLQGQKTDYLGHNPAGGLSVMLMLGLLLVQVISGLFGNDDVLYEGPFYALVSEETAGFLGQVHETNFDLILLALFLHLGAVAWYSLKGQTLVRNMMRGGKTEKNNLIQSIWVALAWCLLSALFLYALLNGLPQLIEMG